MKAKTLAGIGILLTVITLGYASAEKTADRPPGIGADQWYPISDRLGLVVSDYQPGLDPLVDNDHVKPVPAPSGATLPPRPACGAPSCGAMPPASVVPGLSGYLMIKHAGHWIRMSVMSPPILPPGTEGASP